MIAWLEFELAYYDVAVQYVSHYATENQIKQSQKEMDTATRVQILDETDCISHSTNTLGKGMNPIILPPAIGK